MGLKYIQGDLFQTPNDIIGHGCNCQGVMGSGVAKIVRDQYPKAYNEYREHFEDQGLNPGDAHFSLQPNGKWIANLMTQDRFLPRGIDHADYEGIRTAMGQLKDFAKSKGLSIAIPKIGAGLAGGDWTRIEKILEEVFSDYDITIYHL